MFEGGAGARWQPGAVVPTTGSGGVSLPVSKKRAGTSDEPAGEDA